MSSLAATNRGKILGFQELLVKINVAGGEVPDCPLEHFFAHESYGRKIVLPKGSVVVGKIHRHSHLNFVMRGSVSVMTDEGIEHIVAPACFVSTPGTKRVVYAREETIWVTVHVTKETDLAKIEEEIIAPSFESLGLDVSDKELLS
jgi:hypothetical protein